MLNWHQTISDDVMTIPLQSAQLDGIYVDPDAISGLDHAMTGVDSEGLPVVILGSQEVWNGRRLAWAFLAENAGEHMTSITRKALSMIQEQDYHRFEMHVQVGFGAGERWAQMLGFKKEAVLARFFPDKTDAGMWVRLNG